MGIEHGFLISFYHLTSHRKDRKCGYLLEDLNTTLS